MSLIEQMQDLQVEFRPDSSKTWRSTFCIELRISIDAVELYIYLAWSPRRRDSWSCEDWTCKSHPHSGWNGLARSGYNLYMFIYGNGTDTDGQVDNSDTPSTSHSWTSISNNDDEFLKNPVLPQKHTCTVLGIDSLECIVETEQNDTLKPTIEVDFLHYKEAECWQMPIKRHI